ncbi:MAG TPA: radical SAM protein [Chitinivibrionales bacterium]|nr:radical SAM protein [Chitinivibrionales bacterium]
MESNSSPATSKAQRPRLLLINPYAEIKQYVSNVGFARLIGKKVTTTPLALPLLAALTPSRWEVRIIDEELEPLPQDITADLVGITALSNTVDRAYVIADSLRKRGMKVVMGGPSASCNVHEALLHADGVVIGEAEEVWKSCLDDCEAGRLAKTYKADKPAPYKTSPRPRWDLIDTKNLAAMPVQVSRGCPHHCDFCLVSELFGIAMRYRDVDDVVDEIKSLPMKTIFFVDDNLTANKEYAARLMKRIMPLGVKWMSQASMEIAKHPDLLEDMARAGCMHILVGFESMNEASLGEAHKRHNDIRAYAGAVRAINEHGIHVNASMIVGFDNDTPDEFKKIYDFIHAENLWYVNLNLLDAIPGTSLHRRIAAEGRWVNRPNNLTGGMFPTIRYKQMTQVELFDGFMHTMRRLYSWDDLHDRITALFSTGWFNRPEHNPDISLLDKILMTFKIVWLFLIAGGPAKRRVFLSLFRLIRKRRVTPEKVVFFLMTVEGMNRLTRQLLPDVPGWRDKFASVDAITSEK